jgi:ribosomal protein S12 methylthiotransferase accessory factor
MREPALELARRFTHRVTAGDTVVLVGDRDSALLETPEAVDVVHLVDGRRTALDVAAALEGRHRPEVVHFVILSLLRGGLLQEVSGIGGGDPGPDPEAPDRGGAIAARLSRAWMERGEADIVTLAGAELGVTRIALVLTDDYLHARLPERVDALAAAHPAVLLTRLGRRSVWLGPSLTRGAGPCIACLQARLRLNLTARTLVHLEEGDRRAGLRVERLGGRPPPRAFRRLGAALVSMDGAASSSPGPGTTSRGSPSLPGAKLLAIGLDDGGQEAHPVARLPQCPRCGDPARAPPGADFELRRRPRAGGSGTGYRVVEPTVTWERLSPLISPLTGVVRRVQRVDVEDPRLVHVYTASHARHFGTGSLEAVRGDRRDPSGGKGSTDLEARVSALCESLERFSSVHRGDEPVRNAPFAEVQGDAVHPNELLLFSRLQYEERERSNAADPSGFQWVPEPYGGEEIEWSRARSLVTGEVRLVPAACVYFGFEGRGSRFCKGDSNGLAGGNCLEEAVLQGFLELVERDAVALWWYNRARVRGVDLASFQDAWMDALAERYPRWGRSLWALDLTTDLGIPCFAALSSRPGGGREDIIFGFGAHLDPAVALRRALAEVNQMLPTVERSPEERRRQLLPEFADAVRWWDKATLEDHPYLAAAPDRPAAVTRDFGTPTSEDLLEDVRGCVDRAARVGLDVLVHDLSRPDIDFAVARVIVPGLRHFWRRLGPGRLYDVPPRIRWIDEARTEREMNPVAMFV